MNIKKPFTSLVHKNYLNGIENKSNEVINSNNVSSQ